MQRTGALQELLNAMTQALLPGAEALHDTLLWFWQFFAFMELLFAVYRFGVRGAPIGSLLQTIMRAGAVYWLLDWWPTLLQWTMETMVAMGLVAGGGGTRFTVVNLLDPATYVNQGLNLGALLYEKTMASFGLWSVPLALSLIIFYILFMGAFVTIAASIFIWQVEILLASVLGLMLLPCLASGWTAWAARGLWGYLVNMSFKLGSTAFFIAFTFPLMERFMITNPVTLQSAMITTAGAWAYTLVLFRINKITASVLSGFPQLSFGDVVAHAIGTVTTAIGVASGGAAVVSAGAATLGRAAGGAMVVGTGMGRGIASLATGAGTRPALGAGQSMAAGVGGSPLLGRMGSFVGGAGQMAQRNAVRSIRAFAQTSRYIGGQDRPMSGGAHR